MPHIERILCPVDFSETSDVAFTYADDFAAWAEAGLIVAHAFDDPISYDHAGQTEPADAGIKQQMLEVKSNHDSVVLTRVLHAGDPGRVICWLAEDLECDLIIMGTHGRTGLVGLLFGSTAKYVLQHARCPVLTIRQQKQGEPPLQEPMVTPLPAPRYM